MVKKFVNLAGALAGLGELVKRLLAVGQALDHRQSEAGVTKVDRRFGHQTANPPGSGAVKARIVLFGHNEEEA